MRGFYFRRAAIVLIVFARQCLRQNIQMRAFGLRPNRADCRGRGKLAGNGKTQLVSTIAPDLACETA